MPAVSQAQQKLLGMAWAVRKGELERSKVSKEVLDIADGDMTDKDLKHFAETSQDNLPKHKKSLKECLQEALEFDMT